MFYFLLIQNLTMLCCLISTKFEESLVTAAGSSFINLHYCHCSIDIDWHQRDTLLNETPFIWKRKVSTFKVWQIPALIFALTLDQRALLPSRGCWRNNAQYRSRTMNKNGFFFHILPWLHVDLWIFSDAYWGQRMRTRVYCSNKVTWMWSWAEDGLV